MTRNVAASVRQRLLNRSRDEGRPFQELLQFFVMERFLYRLSRSQHADRFVLKGALMLQVWESPQSRPTRDIDMLGRTENEPDALLQQIREALATDVVPDGIAFDLDSLEAEPITADAEYQGIRLLGWAHLARARARLQIDVGFGDAVRPAPVRSAYPVLLDLPAPELLCYSRETAIAEKFQAMVSLGELNSRMKDFFDVWLLCRQFEFDVEALAEAIHATFEQRDTALPERPLFSDRFRQDTQRAWAAFVDRLGGTVPIEPEFGNVLEVLEEFLGGPMDHLAGRPLAEAWTAGRWTPSGNDR